ncbi:MAG: carbon-nitrogen hydrolase family protein [Proteobacteria bacterium]|nr:carbon-nitrogen hydrolase family protein [Pseudomonadota bacterium]MDA0959531.1 carbon-nitrogen hydrolase family protein [Pseudomonadota bacterium]MDA1151817.1 carbon-nitrogen hydrolase family protein [Pseudomonadota bacterium]
MFSVAAVQYCSSDSAKETLTRIRPLIVAAAQQARFVTLPECASYLAASREQLATHAEWEDDSYSQRWLADMAKQLGIWLLAGSLMMRRRDDKRLVNRSLLIGPDGRQITSYDKIHMFDANVGDGKTYQESASFTAGNAPVIAMIDDMPVGLSICYDLRFPHLYRQLARDGAKLLMVPAAFTAVSGRAHWHVLLRARAIETGCFIVAPAQFGKHADGRQTYGHSLIINPWGEIIAEGDDGDAVIAAMLDIDEVDRARRAIPSLQTNPVIGTTRLIK